jgi:predicted ATPase
VTEHETPVRQEDGSLLFKSGVVLTSKGVYVLPNGSHILPQDDTRPLLEEALYLIDHHGFKAGKHFTFRAGVNLLVGEQGSGKSTLLGSIKELTNKNKWYREKAEKILRVQMQNCHVALMDFEKDNQRTMSHFAEGQSVGFHIAAMKSSHGEAVRATLAGLREQLLQPNASRTLVMLDEPDMALSPRSAHILARLLKELAAQGHQIIAAVHNPIVIASQNKVYSLEHGRWLKAQTFLDKHAQDAGGEFDPYLKPFGADS